MGEAMIPFGDMDIREALTDEDVRALGDLVNIVRRERMLVAEVGSWKGHSTSILAKNILNSHGSVFAVDHWRGNEGTWNIAVVNTQDVYSIFRLNMIELGLWDIVHPLVMDSQTACRIFADGILDLVFLDGDHRYECIKQDILSWLPKLRVGGILCGHDCEGYYSQCTKESQRLIDASLDEDYIGGCHPGVIKALYEHFEDTYKIMPDTTIWYHIIR